MHLWHQEQRVQSKQEQNLTELEVALFMQAEKDLYRDLKNAAPDENECDRILIRSTFYNRLSERQAAHVREIKKRLCEQPKKEEKPSLLQFLELIWNWMMGIASGAGAFIGCVTFVTGKETLADLFPTLAPLLHGVGQIPTWYVFAGSICLLIAWFLARRLFRR